MMYLYNKYTVYEDVTISRRFTEKGVIAPFFKKITRRYGF